MIRAQLIPMQEPLVSNDPLDPAVIFAKVRFATNVQRLLDHHHQTCAGAHCDIRIIEIVEDAQKLGIGIV